MLPDQARIKSELSRILMRRANSKIKEHLGPFADSPKHVIHEGAALRVNRPDGSSDQNNLALASAEFTLKKSDVPTISPMERVALIDQLAQEIGEKIQIQLLEELNKVVEKTGNTVVGNGRGFTPELIMELLDKMNLDFRPDGRFEELTVSLSSSGKESFAQALRLIESDAQYKAEFESLVDKKRMEWRDREITRKLVG